jgi:hypothetical protein
LKRCTFKKERVEYIEQERDGKDVKNETPLPDSDTTGDGLAVIKHAI